MHPAVTGPTATDSCPIEYRYRATDFAVAPSLAADVVYVVGGLYGNVEALRTICALAAQEGARLVFNGDHNWLNIDRAGFAEVNERVLASTAIRGNVESELDSPIGTGCGCNYPSYVNAEYVDRSNAIMDRLRMVAAEFPALRSSLVALPRFRTIAVGAARIGIVHGDAESLAGWGFAAERLSPIAKCCSGDDASGELTPAATIERYFRESTVDAFACTHTCLAHARDYTVDGRARLIINNGASGLPNFAGTHYGIVTRIAADRRAHPQGLYGIDVAGVRFDAIPVHFDHAAFVARFLANWPAGSPAHTAYFDRIRHGPNFDLADAVAGRVALAR